MEKVITAQSTLSAGDVSQVKAILDGLLKHGNAGASDLSLVEVNSDVRTNAQCALYGVTSRVYKKFRYVSLADVTSGKPMPALRETFADTLETAFTIALVGKMGYGAWAKHCREVCFVSGLVTKQEPIADKKAVVRVLHTVAYLYRGFRAIGHDNVTQRLAQLFEDIKTGLPLGELKDEEGVWLIGIP